MPDNDGSRGGVLDDLADSLQSGAPRLSGAADVWAAEGDVLRDLLGDY